MSVLDTMMGEKSRLIVVNRDENYSLMHDNKIVPTHEAWNTGEELVELGWAVEVMNTESTIMYRINDTTGIAGE